MRFRIRLDEAAAAHRAAVEEAAQILEGQDPRVWTIARAEGKWSPAEIAQHLILAYGPPLAELDGGAGFALRLPWWKRAALRWTVVPRILGGRFPKGAPAPRESRPKSGAASPTEAARILRETSGRFERRLLVESARRRVKLTHPYFGGLTAAQILKLVAVHTAHHRAQLPADAAGARVGY